MKKSKIALATVMAAALGVSALGLAACGEDEKKTSKPKDTGVYTITFDANGGGYAEGVSTPVTRKTSGGKLTSFPDSPAVAPSEHPDYTFKGWALSSSATADDALSLPVTFKGNDTLYAIWGGTVSSTGAYLVTFDANGGEVVGESTMTTVDGKLTSTLPGARNGDKEFLGWYTVKDSKDDTEKVVVNVTPFTAPTTVYASWGEEATVTEYYVTFNANGGAFDGGNTTSIQTTGGVIAELPTPDERSGYTATGYYYKDADDKEVPFTNETKVTERNLVVYVKWEPVPTENYITVGEKKVNQTDRQGGIEAGDERDRRYSIGSMLEDGVDLKKGDTFTITVDGKPIDFYLVPRSTGVDTSAQGKITEISVTNDDNFEIYIDHYKQSSTEQPRWVVEVKGKTTEAPKPKHTGKVTVDGVDTALVDNTNTLGTWDPTAEDDKDAELTVTFKPGKDKAFTLTVDDKQISFFLQKDSKGLTGETEKAGTTLTTTTDGTYTLYIKHYPVNDKHNPPRTEEVWSVYGSYTGATEAQDENGIYLAGSKTPVKALVANGTDGKEVMVEYVRLEKDAVVTFKYNNKVINVKMKDGDTNSKKVQAQSDGTLKVLEGCTFTMYLTLEGGELWVEEKEDVVESQLKEGDGLVAGSEVKGAFAVNTGAVNEIKAEGVALTAKTELTLKYAGAAVTDFTLKASSQVLSTVLAGGKLTLEAGTYNFYYNYAKKELYIGVVGAKVEADTLYLVGGMNGWELNPAYKLVSDKITLKLAANTELRVVVSDAKGELDWSTQTKLTLDSTVAAVSGDNIKITGGEATYVITVSGTTVSVKKEGDTSDPVSKKDGVYVGDTLIKAFVHGTDQSTIEHITIAPNSTLAFFYKGTEVKPEIEKSNGKPCTEKIVKNADGTYTCAGGGTFTMYYKPTGNLIWISDEADRVAPNLQTGDGMIAGETVHAFTVNEGGLNEVWVLDVKFAAQTKLTLKYAGAPVTDYTLKKDSLGTLASGTLTLPAGTYSFYYDYVAKTL